MHIHVILFAGALFSPAPADPRDALQEAIVTLRHFEDSTANWRVSYSTTAEIPRELSRGESQQRSSQIVTRSELRSGARYRLSEKIATDGGKSGVNGTAETSFDGTELRYGSFPDKVGTRTPESQPGWQLLQELYGEAEPLSTVLGRVAENGEVGWVRVQGRPLLRCIDRRRPEFRKTFDLDPSVQWQPRAISSRDELPAGIYPDGRVGESVTREFSEFTREGAIVIPRQVRKRHEVRYADGRTWERSTSQLDLLSIDLAPKFADTEFVYEFPQGLRVADVFKGVSYVVGVPGSERPLASANAVEEIRPRLTPEGAQYRRWADGRLWGALAGLFVLAAAVLYWRRARS